jgi:hypothetical protein
MMKRRLKKGDDAMIPGWKEEIHGEYLQLLRDCPTASPAEVAARLGVSERCATYWLTDLAKDGRVRIVALELAEAPLSALEPPALPRSHRRSVSPLADGAVDLQDAA